MGISVGMVGLGMFGRHFIDPVKKHPLVDRIALCDINRDRLAEQSKQHGIKECYESLDDICRSDIDALMIITQPWLHAGQVIQALEAGKHAYSAVPITTSATGSGSYTAAKTNSGTSWWSSFASSQSARRLRSMRRTAMGAMSPGGGLPRRGRGGRQARHGIQTAAGGGHCAC